MRVLVRCAKCDNPVGLVILPDNLREIVPIQFRPMLAFLPDGFTLDAETISRALVVECVQHSPQGGGNEQGKETQHAQERQ